VRDAAIVFDPPYIAFADPLFVLEYIEEPQFHRNLLTLDREAALYQPFGPNGRPVFEIKSAQRNPALLRMLDVSRTI
jgi:hypothetical protein